MTISDLIAQLTRIMKETGPTVQVRLGSSYNSMANPFDAFEVRKPIEGKDVYIVPSDVWLRSARKRRDNKEVQP